MNHSRILPVRFALIALALCLIGYSSYAQAQPIRLDVDEDIARAGNETPFSVYFENDGDSVDAFQFVITLNRSDLMTFENDLSGNVPVVVARTLTENWEYVQADRIDDSTVRVTALGSSTGDTPVVVPPNSAGILVKVLAQVDCVIPDTMTNRTAIATIDPSAVYFSDPSNELLEPIGLVDGAVSVTFTQSGDMDGDGFHTALDLSRLINALFAGGSPGCPPCVSDMDCDGFPTPIDLAWLIDYMFAGGVPPPMCCP